MTRKYQLADDMVPDWDPAWTDLDWAGEFTVSIKFSPAVLAACGSPENIKRLRDKLELVHKFAERMAAGMLKGTMKYKEDRSDPEYWRQHLMDEMADIANYNMLLEASWENSRL